MKNPFRNLDEIQSDVGRIAIRLTKVQLFHVTVPRGGWQPAVNVFRCSDQFIICVDLAGVDKSAIEVRAEARAVLIRGVRPLSEPSCHEPPAAHVLALEIDHGPFERTIDLSDEVDPGGVTAEHRNGLLWVRLPIRAGDPPRPAGEQ